MEEMNKRTIIKVRKRKNEEDKRKDGRGRMEKIKERTEEDEWRRVKEGR